MVDKFLDEIIVPRYLLDGAENSPQDFRHRGIIRLWHAIKKSAQINWKIRKYNNEIVKTLTVAYSLFPSSSLSTSVSGGKYLADILATTSFPRNSHSWCSKMKERRSKWVNEALARASGATNNLLCGSKVRNSSIHHWQLQRHHSPSASWPTEWCRSRKNLAHQDTSSLQDPCLLDPAWRLACSLQRKLRSTFDRRPNVAWYVPHQRLGSNVPIQ